MSELTVSMVPIFAQAGYESNFSNAPLMLLFPLLIGMATLFLIVGLPIWLYMRNAARERDLEHTERMKALELGRSLPGDAPPPPPRIAVAIGAGVPIGVFGVVWLAVLTTGTDGSFAWPAAGGVGLAAVICGSILAYHLPHVTPAPAEKPAFDPEAYDAIAHRG
ncbi:hypothetical protein BH23PLA1_BH23PLA1_03560 [soil metagenome]